MSDSKQRPTGSLRIHGDNIIECERALSLIADSYAARVHPIISALYMPQYEIRCDDELLFTVELLPGHGRWNVNLQEVLRSCGAPLREAADAVVTQVSPDGQQEEILLAFEFCNALPAGNNAWQRNGRALVCAVVGVPYLYFAEVGGVELDKNRVIKAPRFPNPIVPFSYLTASRSFNVTSLPVYSPSPSSSKAIRARFDQVFGFEEGQLLIRRILENVLTDAPGERLTRKVLTLIEILAGQRQHVDTLRGKQWVELLDLETAEQKATWLEQEQNRMAWSKKRAGKVPVTETFESFFRLFRQTDPIQTCISVGARSIPLCLVPRLMRENLAKNLSTLYDGSVTTEFVKWVASSDLPLIVVWIYGFKPGGEDSRPDRGLVPMARMLFGNEVDILSIVYGPARPAMWEAFQNSPQQLASQNGLWETIINLGDAILVDSVTASGGPMSLLLQRGRRRFRGRIHFPSASPPNVFSEQDVDTTIHLLFAHRENLQVFEAMCNPPGGDWSGLSILNFETGEEFRWTSLPRVSGAGGKRPDHVIEFLLDNGQWILLAIESKDRVSRLERNVGTRLRIYTRQLVESPPTIARVANAEWELWQVDSIPLPGFSIVSGGAFCWTGEKDLENSLTRGQLNIAFAIEFRSIEQSALLHIKVSAAAEFLFPKLYQLVQQFRGRLEIQIH